MTEKECLAAGIAVSLFAHFALLIAPRPPEPEPSFTTVVQMDMASPAVATSREKGIGIAAASPRDMDKADAADRKRQAFLRYLDDIDEAVHARRLDGGETVPSMRGMPCLVAEARSLSFRVWLGRVRSPSKPLWTQA